MIAQLSILPRAVQETIDLVFKGCVNFVGASDDVCGVLTVEAEASESHSVMKIAMTQTTGMHQVFI